MPRKGTNDLFELVHSMTPSEKRYFQIRNQRSGKGGQAKYMCLFEVLNSMEIYDRKAVLACLPDIKPEQLPNLKSRLYKTLLQNLTEIQSNDQRSRIHLGQVTGHLETLYVKGLFDQCLKTATQIKKLAYEREHYEVLPEILLWEQKAYGRILINADILASKYARVTKELEHISGILTRLAAVNVIRHRVFSLFSNQGRVVRDRTRAEKIREVARQGEELLYDAQTFKEERTIRHMLLQAYMMLADCEHLLNHCRKIGELFEAVPSRKHMHIVEYIQFLNTYAIALNMSERYEETLQITKVTQEIHTSGEFTLTPPQEALVFDCSVFHQLEVYIRTGQFEKGVRLIPELEKGLERHQPHMNPVNIHSKHYRIALALFGAGNFRESLNWVNNILNSPQLFRKDIQSGVRLLNLILHFELHNLSLVEYAVKSTYRYLKNMQSLYRTETALLHFLRTLQDIRDRTMLHSAFQQLADRLTQLFAEDPLERHALPYFDTIAWLESKVTGKSLSECIQKKRSEKQGPMAETPALP